MLDPRGSPIARRWVFFSQRRSAPLATRSTLNLGCGVVRSTCGLMWMGVFFADTGYRPKGHVSMESYLHEKSHAVRHAQRNTTRQSTTRNATERASFEARPWHQTSATVTRQRAPLQPRVLKAKTAESSTRAPRELRTAGRLYNPRHPTPCRTHKQQLSSTIIRDSGLHSSACPRGGP